MELSDNQAQIRCIDINRPSVRGGHKYVKTYVFHMIKNIYHDFL